MAHGVVHRALRAAVITIGQLTEAFVAFRLATAPTRNYSCGSGHSGQRLVVASLLLFVAVATALGLCPHVGLALPHCHLGDWGVPGMALRSLEAHVRQAEERRNILDVVGGELLQHLLIPYSLVKCNHHRSIRDTGNGIANLREPLDKGAQGFPWALLDGVEVSLIAWPSISTVKVGREPGPGRPRQGYGEVVGHDGLIPPCSEDGGGVDLQEFVGVNHPVILL
jgi:hypothetical protein